MRRPSDRMMHLQTRGMRGRPQAFASPDIARRMSEAMIRYGLQQAELSSLLGSADRPSSNAYQARLQEMLEIVGRVRAWTDTDVEALEWYRNFPVPAFGGKPPAELVRRGMAKTVHGYIEHLAAGGYA